MEVEMFEKCDLVHVLCDRRICTIVEVSTSEPRYKVQFGQDAGSVTCVESNELALVQKFTPRNSGPSFVLATSKYVFTPLRARHARERRFAWH